MPSVSAPSTSSGDGVLGRLGLQREHADLGPVPVRDHQPVIAGECGEGRGGPLDVLALAGDVGRLAPSQQGVAAERDDHRAAGRAGHDRPQSTCDQRVDDRLLGGQAVGRLVPHDRRGTVDHLGGHLLAAMGGEAVHEHGVRRRGRHQRRMSPGRARAPQPAPLRVGLLAHRDPDVGVDGMCAAHGLARILDQGHVTVVPARRTRARPAARRPPAGSAGGDATTTSTPDSAPASISERATLSLSPMYASRRPSRWPNTSRRVRKSASAWQG